MALTQQQIDEINTRIDRFLHLVKEGESSPGGLGTYSPRPGIEIIGLRGKTYTPPKDEDYTKSIESSLENLLQLVHATFAFKEYVKQQFLSVYNLGSDFRTAADLIQGFLDPINNLDNSLFNPDFTHAEMFERNVLITVDLGLRRLFPESEQKYGPLVDKWKEELKKRYVK